MKCKKCGSDLRETDTICLNCGALVTNSDNDLYDDINIDDDDDFNDSDNDAAYNKELDDLLNSYRMEDKKLEVKKSKDKKILNLFDRFKKNKSDKEENIEDTDSKNNIDEYTIDNLGGFIDENTTFEEFNESPKEKKKFELNISIVPFKVVFVIAAVVLIVVCCVFGYKYFSSKKTHKVDYEINKDVMDVTSKYSLTTNPNYITNHTWVCGTMVNGVLSPDRNTYFQYDFNKKNEYARQFLNRPDTYEDGEYAISLEDVSNDRYVYKLYMLANLDGGYKTKYIFTLNVSKDGTTAIYKYNSTVFACEEMNYYNSKFN